MAKLANRAKMTISSTGQGNITLASAVAGYQSFLDAGVSDGDQIRYIIEDNNGADWEIGTAAVSNNSTVLVRTVEESSAANNAALNLTSSAKVFIGVTANDLDNAAPIFTTTPPASLNLETDGSTAVTLNAKAYDESGIPINYSWDAWATGGSTIYDASSLPPQLASAPSINQSTGVFSLVGSSNSANSGNVNFRVKASDGVKVATHNTLLALNFGLADCYGFDITQTSSSNGYVIFKFMLVAPDGSNIHDDTNYASEVVYGSNVDTHSWYVGREHSTSEDDNLGNAYFRTEMSSKFGTTLPASGSGSHYNYGHVANPAATNTTKTITWTTARTIKAILVTGDHTTPYFSGGYVTPYIGGNAASNLSSTSYTLLQGTTSSVANNRYYDFSV